MNKIQNYNVKVTWDQGDAYILVKGTITVGEKGANAATVAAYKNCKQLILKTALHLLIV